MKKPKLKKYICSNNHEKIYYFSNECPLCHLLEVLDDSYIEVDRLEREIVFLS